MWLKRHADNGYILHRPTAATKTASLHLASCPRISAETGAELAKGPRTGCPTKAAALAFALRSKWKVAETCDCTAAPA